MLHVGRQAHHHQGGKQQGTAGRRPVEELVRPVLRGDVLRPHQCAHHAPVGIHHRLAHQLQRALAGGGCGRQRQDQRLRRPHGHHGAGGGQAAGLGAQGFLAAHVDEEDVTAQVGGQLGQPLCDVLADGQRTAVEAAHQHPVVLARRHLAQAAHARGRFHRSLDPAGFGQRLRVEPGLGGGDESAAGPQDVDAQARCLAHRMRQQRVDALLRTGGLQVAKRWVFQQLARQRVLAVQALVLELVPRNPLALQQSLVVTLRPALFAEPAHHAQGGHQQCHRQQQDEHDAPLKLHRCPFVSAARAADGVGPTSWPRRPAGG
ncbi:MAG: hypothetical protein EOO29_17755, partial [Comamonadaceae bacterium]